MMMRFFLIVSVAPTCALQLGVATASLRATARCSAPRAGGGDELGGAISSTFGEIFGSMFKPDADKQAAIDRAYAEQLEVAKARKDPRNSAEHMRQTAERRQKSSEAFEEKFAWQRDTTKDPLIAWKRRQQEGKLTPLGYEDEPEGGIPMPMASFGMGGEFGVGGKYDNGERFDLRLPYAEQGWVDDGSEDDEPVDFFANLLSGGKLQREADVRRRQRNEGGGSERSARE